MIAWELTWLLLGERGGMGGCCVKLLIGGMVPLAVALSTEALSRGIACFTSAGKRSPFMKKQRVTEQHAAALQRTK
jgi:hypothetical protein